MNHGQVLTSIDSHCTWPFGLVNHWQILINIDSHYTWLFVWWIIDKHRFTLHLAFWPGKHLASIDKHRFTLHLAFCLMNHWQTLASIDLHCTLPFDLFMSPLLQRKRTVFFQFQRHCTRMFLVAPILGFMKKVLFFSTQCDADLGITITTTPTEFFTPTLIRVWVTASLLRSLRLFSVF